MCFVPLVLPVPLHVEHGFDMICPSPRHLVQGCTVTNVENPMFRVILTCPCPLHVEHVSGWVPGAQPDPLQASQSTFFLISISIRFPRKTSSRVMFVSYKISWPFCLANPPNPPERPKRFSNMESKPPEPKLEKTSSKLVRAP